MVKEEFDMNTMKEGVRHHHFSIYENDINNMSSLQLYRSVRSSLNIASYLCSKLPFKAIQIKFKLRFGAFVLWPIYTDRKEEMANILGHSNLQDTFYYIVMLRVGFDMIYT